MTYLAIPRGKVVLYNAQSSQFSKREEMMSACNKYMSYEEIDEDERPLCYTSKGYVRTWFISVIIHSLHQHHFLAKGSKIGG
ncbi:hypothetical protein F9C07_12870 [Aspergillus flavus]|uniref:Uncharacterized protein n=1 Tax=Aspergillus flavus (strain ATCC 200026 / FGSC A1120 / IAM 13836 / NRRL 3357 / JCM 12722 / SRRC 167) TaxID=332952 RepID=A0A7U2R262_ASPFN|nr:hypothetical protein F9C07_12870 [Aspergillus flavus]